MKYEVKDLGSYKLHLIKTDNFKTIRVKVFFNTPIKKEEITLRNFLATTLVLTNAKNKTKRDVAIRCEELYACSGSERVTRFGNYSNLCFMMSALEDKYTEAGNFEKCLELLSDMIYNPNVENEEFAEEYFNIIKSNARLNIESIKEDTSNYSVIRLLEELDSEAPFSYRICGNIDDLNKITRKSLYKYYQKMLNNDIMDIFIIGNIDFKEMEELVQKYFPTKVFKKITMPCRLEEKKKKKTVKVVKEQIETNQSKLAIGLRLFGLTDYERNYALTLYSIILGGGTNSKLFQNVREKNSLAYYIFATPNKLDNLLLIRAGISQENFDMVIKLIKENLQEMKKGKISEEELENAKQMYLSSLEELEESQNDIIDSYYMMDLLGVDDIETRKKKMKEVTIKDVVSVAKKVGMDTIYLLEGVKDAE